MVPKHKPVLLFAFIFMSMVFSLATIKMVQAEDQGGDSSACINCHTDLEEMDEYGAQAASSAAAVAG